MAEEANEDSWLYGSNEEQAARREEEELLVLNIGNDSLNYSDEAKIDADQTDPSEMIDTLHADFEAKSIITNLKFVYLQFVF